MEDNIFNIEKIQDYTYKTRWWESKWFQEWQELAKLNNTNTKKPSLESISREGI